MHKKMLPGVVVATMLVLAWPGDGVASGTGVLFSGGLLPAPDAGSLIERVGSKSKQAPEHDRETLERIAADPNRPGEDRMDAICALSGVATGESVPVLLKILERDLKERRGFWGCAIPVIGGLKDRRAVPLLVRIANLDEEHLAGMDHMAIEALAKLADQRELSVLSSKVHILPVRHAVMTALARIASPRSIDILIRGLDAGEERDVIKAAERGLLKIGKAAMPALKATLAQRGDSAFKNRIRKLIAKIEH